MIQLACFDVMFLELSFSISHFHYHELLRLYNIIKNTKDIHIDIVKLKKGYDLIIELGKEIDTTNIKLFKGIFKFMNEFMM